MRTERDRPAPRTDLELPSGQAEALILVRTQTGREAVAKAPDFSEPHCFSYKNAETGPENLRDEHLPLVFSHSVIITGWNLTQGCSVSDPSHWK